MNLRNHSIENNVSFSRIDVSKEKPGEKSKKLFQNDWTVAAWYFPAWEKEYDWDGWEKMAKQCPWRKPLLYDSLDRGAQHHGIQYYANSNPTVIDWHIHWMCEYGINLMLWDWYPVVTENGDFETSTFQNRALETGFLGKTLLGGPPVETNRFAEIMPFAIAWINHEPFQKISSNIFDYMVDNFLQQPNYYKIDGRPLIIFWSSQGLLEQLQSKDKTIRFLLALRETSKKAGLANPYFVTCNIFDKDSALEAEQLGFDGVMAYNIIGYGGKTEQIHRQDNQKWIIQVEDFVSQTIPSHEHIWNELSSVFGYDLFVPTMPMQDWRPIHTRDVHPYVSGISPENYRILLQRAKKYIEKTKKRKFITIEAWNEWYEGSYIEPSTEYGYSWLEVIRDEFKLKE